MKIIHTADLHLFSPLSSRLESLKVSERKRELNQTLERIAAYARERGIYAIIIAGDLFDSDRLSTRSLKTIAAIFQKYSEISFFYLAGNHERDILTASGITLPPNLFVFGKDWTYFELDGVCLVGKSESCENMFESLTLSDKRKNIVCLHGEVCDKSRPGGAIGLSEARGKGISYMALGHYHSYGSREFDIGAFAVYPGCPEGRGFDEAGERGFVIIDTQDMSHTFVPFSKRQVVIREIDITAAKGQADIDRAIRLGTADIDRGSLVRCVLFGEREIDLAYDTDLLKSAMSESFFCFDIKDKTRLAINPDKLKYDKTLKGEFIRLCLSDGQLTAEDREAVIKLGISALLGEAVD